MQSIIKNKLISSIVFLVLGIVLMISPAASLKVFMYVIGGVLLLSALVRILTFFKAKKEDRVPLSLVLGIASAVIGLFFVIAPGFISSILAVVFGVVIILNSLLDLVIAVRLPAGKAIAVVMALLGLALGILIVINPAAFAEFMTVLIGVSLVYESVVGIVTMLFARKVAKSSLLK